MSQASSLSDRRLGRYRVLQSIGKGGMGEVYLAVDERLERQVALKVLREGTISDESARKQFRQEALALSKLNHPNIATIFDYDFADGFDFLVTEYIGGATLKEKLAAGSLPREVFLSMAIQLAEGLEAAHAKGIVHRDLKPGNLRLTLDDRLKILDFGLAVLLASDLDATATLSESTGISGTLPYMSPEQLQALPVDQRSDIWSAGVVFYEMVTGHRPFAQTISAVLLDAILRRNPDPPSRLNPAVSRATERVILRALEKDASRRFQSAGELLQALHELKDFDSVRNAPGFVPAGAPLTSVAVLPFADMSAEKDQEYFCDGIAEELINSLAKVEGLQVVCRSSAFKFRSNSVDLSQVREMLRVDSIVEGGVRRAGNRLRVTVRLIDANTGFESWSERYDGELRDVFEVQDEIAQSVATALRGKFGGAPAPPVVSRRTENLQAFDLYLKGRDSWNKRVPDAVRRAFGYFQQALAEDPGYAAAKAGMADCMIVPGYYGLAPARDVYPPAKAAALEALRLDPSLAEANATLGAIAAIFEYSWKEAENYFRKAQQLNPSYATSFIWCAMFVLVPQGRFEEALEQCRRARLLDPLSAVVTTVTGMIHYFAARYKEAAAELRAALAADPAFPIAHYYLGAVCAELGELDFAVEEFRTADRGLGVPLSGATAHLLARNFMRHGQPEQARQVLGDLQAEAARRYIPANYFAILHAVLGEQEKAFHFLEQACEERSGPFLWVKVDPAYDSMRPDSRFAAVLAKMNLA